MRSVFVDEGLSRISKEKFWYYGKANVFFAIQSLLKDVTPVAVGGELHDPATNCLFSATMRQRRRWRTNRIQATILRRSSTVEAASRQRWTAQFPNLRGEEGRLDVNGKEHFEAYLWAIISKPRAQIASTIFARSSASATLSFCWRKIEACWSEDLMIRATKTW